MQTIFTGPCIPMIPVCLSVGVKLRDVHVLALPGRLVVGEISPLDQVMYVVLFINTDIKKGKQKYDDTKTKYSSSVSAVIAVEILFPL